MGRGKPKMDDAPNYMVGAKRCRVW